MYDSTIDDAENAVLVGVRAGLLEQQRVIAAAEAERARLLAAAEEVARARMARSGAGSVKVREMERRSIALEFAVALRVSDIAVQNQMVDAATLVGEYPATLDALSEGAISRRHVDHIVKEGIDLADAAVRGQYESVVLEKAVKTTPARTQRFAERAAERLHPRSLTQRHAAAVEQRCVKVMDLAHGMSQLTVVASAVLVHGIFDRLTRQAKAIKTVDRADRKAWAQKRAAARQSAGAAGAGGSLLVDEVEPSFDERTIDQTRTDLLTDLILTGRPAIDPTTGESAQPGVFTDGLGSIRAEVQITIPVTTATGVTDGGAELDGRSPVDAETARRLAGKATSWIRVMTDPVKGTVLEVDNYEPRSAQRRFVDSRDVTCRTPGCRRPARYCQIDHNEEHHQGGKTATCNLCCLCVRHHTLKTETGWTVRQLPGGVLEFTSPLGFEYTEDPPTRVVFLPEPGDEAAPF